eukprot:COSAG02_NODE_516_length_20804_cov_162.717460_15_plen_953_part_00
MEEPSGWGVGSEEAVWLIDEAAGDGDSEFDNAGASNGESMFDHSNDSAWVLPLSATETEASAAESAHEHTIPGAQAPHVRLPDISTVRWQSPARSESQAKKQRRNYVGVTLLLDQVEMLMGRELGPRPTVLDSANTPQVEYGGWVFKETGNIKRKGDPRADKWRRGGGVGGATDLPSSLEPRMRRRYGYVIPAEKGAPRLRFHQYCRLLPTKKVDGPGQGDGNMNVEEDSQTWLYHVLPENSPVVETAPAAPIAKVELPRSTQVLGALRVEAEMDSAATNGRDALLCLSAAGRPTGKTTNFVRFEEAGRELGGIYHSDHGVQLRSAAGDFAEWHRALNLAELPYIEGSVVGLFGGKISLKTVDADMVAVVSRRALCVGSFPGPDKAVEGDIVAYLGQVPVRVRGQVVSGDTLVPSARHDGTAIAWQRQDEANAGEHDNAAIIGIAMSAYMPGKNRSDGIDADVGLVDALITPPSAQQRTQPQGKQKLSQKSVDPALDFLAYQYRSANKRRALFMRTCVAILVITCLALTLKYGVLVASSRCDGMDCAGGSVHYRPRAMDQDPCVHVSCGPGNCTVVDNLSTAANLWLYTSSDDSVQTDGAVKVRCDCPEGFSSKRTVDSNGTATLSCESNVCSTVRSSLIDPVASHTLQWAQRWAWPLESTLLSKCDDVSTSERCQYHCDPGYLPEGEALCLPNGTLVGGGCVPVQCKPLAIPHSNRADGNECTGFTGDLCNFTCAKGYRRAQALATAPSDGRPAPKLGKSEPDGLDPLLCGSTQEFESNLVFAVSGAVNSMYNGMYTMLNRTCRGRAIWQKQRQLEEENTSAIDNGPVLYAARHSEERTLWMLGPAARVVDCSDLNVKTYAQNTDPVCTKAPGPRFGSRTLQSYPDIVACNPPVSTWCELLPSCEGVGINTTCHCDTEVCFFYSPTLRVERVAVPNGAADELCVQISQSHI